MPFPPAFRRPGHPVVVRLLACAACGLLAAAAPSRGDAAIVNSLRSFAAADSGWSGAVEGAYEESGGNTVETSLSSDLQIQWHSRAETVRLLGSYDRDTSGGVLTSRALMGHLRHNHRLGRHWSTLAFTQLQENPFQRLKLRVLAGAGLRWDATRAGAVQLALGAANMWERDRVDHGGGTSDAMRLSSFVSLLATLRPGATLDLSAFWQPAWSGFADWRALVELDLGFALGGGLELVAGWKLEHDSRPPAGVHPTDRATTTGLRLNF